MSKIRLFYLPSGREVWLDALQRVDADLFEPVLWLGDDRLTTSARESFPNCKFLSSSAFKNGVFPRDRCSVVPGSIRSGATFLLAEKFALYSLIRYENSGLIPFLRKRDYVSTVADYIYSAVLETEPTHVIMSEAPHTVADLLAIGICEELNIDILHFQKCGVAPWARPRLGLHYRDPVVGLANLALSPSVPPMRDRLQSWMSNLSERLETSQPAVSEQLSASREERLRGWKGRVRSVLPAYYAAKLLRDIEVENGRPGGPRLKPLPRSVNLRTDARHLFDAWQFTRHQRNDLKRSQDLISRRRAETQNCKKVTFFLHFEPEITSIPEGGINSDQLVVARALRASLPNDYVLEIREHPSQLLLSTRGYLGRDPNFYEELTSLGRVSFSDDLTSYRDSILSSELVVTLAGTVAIEARMLGKRALAVGHPWYSGLRGCEFVNDLADLRWRVESLLALPAAPRLTEAELLDFISLHFVELSTVPSDERYWRQQGWNPTSEVDSLEAIFSSFFTGNLVSSEKLRRDDQEIG